MSNNTDKLFQPFSVNSLTLKNKTVMAPMTRAFSPNNVPTKEVAAYYRRRAEGNVGLIITEGTFISHKGSNGYENVPAIHGEAALAGWKHVVDEVHAAGGKIAPQLWHVGSVRKLGTGPDKTIPAYSPSGLWYAGRVLEERSAAVFINSSAISKSCFLTLALRACHAAPPSLSSLLPPSSPL